jgi:cyclase
MHPSARCATTGLVLATLVGASVAVPAHAQTVDVQRLSDRVLVGSVPALGRRNVVAVSAKKGLVLIDTGVSPSLMAKLKEEFERQFGRRDWAYVINTHGHWDGHVGGNALFKDIPIIGHDNAAADMKARVAPAAANGSRFCEGQALQLQTQVDAGSRDSEALSGQIEFWRALGDELAKPEVVFPTVTFSDELTIHMGDLTLHAMYFGRAHSASDVVVHIPEERLLVTGSVFYHFFPGITDDVRLIDLRRSISALDRVLEAGVERVVPSHAAVLGRQDVERTRDYYRDLLAAVTAARSQGLTLEKAQAQLGLDQRFPYMSGVQAQGGSREEAHAANVATVWKLVQQLGAQQD